MEAVIQAKQGKLRGALQKSALTGDEFYSFLGIPFAQPPIGQLRFQAPIPLEKWDGILDATKDGMPCTQLDLATGVLIGSEDCLFLNVYTPKQQVPVAVRSPNSRPGPLLPVMFFIHGGGFTGGDGASVTYAPDFLINYGVLLVTTNYRLHALGFLNMGRDTKGAVANCGLRDQILALKWVRENVAYFGGDPQNVTLFGESAGASSVHHLMLSPLAKGLFHKAILQSGTFNCSWSLNSEPEKSGYALAKKLGFGGDEEPEKVVEFLKTQSADRIVSAVNDIHQDWKREFPGKSVSLCFLPSVEADKENGVLPQHPQILMKSADPIPLIVGVNDKEGRLAFIALADNLLDSLRRDLSNCVKHDMKCDEEATSAICDKIREFYLGEKQVGSDTADAIVDLYTDILFKNFYESFENYTDSQCPVYVYEFGFHGAMNFYTPIFMKDLTISHGAAHADELPYLFFKPSFLSRLAATEFVDPELTVIRNMCSLWSNFARTGNPTEGMDLEWKPHTVQQPRHLRIDYNLNLIEEKITPRRIEFWNKLQIFASKRT